MHVSYYENDCRTGLDIDYHDSDIHVIREDGHIHFSIARRCEGVRVWTELCFNCEQYEHFLCELMRVACGERPCECDERPRRTAELFDQDDCEEIDIEVEVERPTRKSTPTRKINTKGGK